MPRRDPALHRAVVLCSQDLAEWRSSFAAGDVPAALPYEVDALGLDGFQVDAFGRSGGPFIRRLRDVVEHRRGYAVQAASRAARSACGADFVLALLEREGVLPSLWRRRGLPPYAGTPLVVWSCWLADDLRKAEAPRREQIKRQLDGVDLLTHLSPTETEIFTDLGIPEDRLYPVTYGVSHRFYTPGSGPRDIPVLAVGQDRGRDYRTLFEAVRGTDIQLTVVCRQENLVGLEAPPNVTVLGPVPHRTYRDLLRRAQVLAVPTQVLAYPTGSSVALEGASSGCCIVVTDTPAMREYFTDGDDARMLPPQDPGAWREELARLLAADAERARLGANARQLVERRFNAQNMWRGLVSVMGERGLIDTPPSPVSA